MFVVFQLYGHCRWNAISQHGSIWFSGHFLLYSCFAGSMMRDQGSLKKDKQSSPKSFTSWFETAILLRFEGLNPWISKRLFYLKQLAGNFYLATWGALHRQFRVDDGGRHPGEHTPASCKVGGDETIRKGPLRYVLGFLSNPSCFFLCLFVPCSWFGWMILNLFDYTLKYYDKTDMLFIECVRPKPLVFATMPYFLCRHCYLPNPVVPQNCTGSVEDFVGMSMGL